MALSTISLIRLEKIVGYRPRKEQTNSMQCSLARMHVYHENIKQVIAPAGGRDDMPHADSIVRLAADLRPSADWSAVRTWQSYRQPACL